jgi:hypothetical protein
VLPHLIVALNQSLFLSRDGGSSVNRLREQLLPQDSHSYDVLDRIPSDAVHDLVIVENLCRESFPQTRGKTVAQKI